MVRIKIKDPNEILSLALQFIKSKKGWLKGDVSGGRFGIPSPKLTGSYRISDGCAEIEVFGFFSKTAEKRLAEYIKGV